MTEETQHKVKEIKQSLRQLMNGVTAKSMREKGMDYHLSWGASIPDLQKMAAEYGKDYSLAIELWKENIRECKILATMIMPPEEMPVEIVELWMEQTPRLTFISIWMKHLCWRFNGLPLIMTLNRYAVIMCFHDCL